MEFFESLTEIVENVGTALVNAFSKVSTIFYVPGTGGASGSITLIGYLALAGLAISLLGLGIRTVLKLIKQKA